MRKALARGLVIIIEASLFVLAELIMKRSKRNESFSGLHRVHCGRPGAGHASHSWQLVRREHRHTHGRFIS
jgi:hypothetical protein